MASECQECGAYEEPENGIFVEQRPTKRIDPSSPDKICTVCWSEILSEETLLSPQEADVASLKSSGLSHRQVADMLDIEPTQVGTVVGRISDKVEEGARTNKYVGGIALSPRGDGGGELLDAVPEERLDEVVWLNPQVISKLDAEAEQIDAESVTPEIQNQIESALDSAFEDEEYDDPHRYGEQKESARQYLYSQLDLDYEY